ncbi:MAG: phage holin family protein [Holdemanella sp.]|uniref:phage holin family protein n=1 Tax=Holdemanella sp. TaxID=1971762 RepID=UPI002586C893|nr:phage holin family protein [Holdemanella sp.]MCI7166162.1 phage holin family protein [Holdemanella sp.]
MDISFLTDYCNVIIVGICLCVGYVIKQSMPSVDNKYIPLVMAILGVIIALWINMGVTPQIILSGLFSGLASTGLHQMFTKLINQSEGE